MAVSLKNNPHWTTVPVDESANAGQRGNILLTVLWIIIALVVITLGLTTSARMDIERTRMLKERTKAYWVARSGVEKTKYDFAAARTRAEEDMKPKTKYTYEFDQGYAICFIESETSKMPVNSQNRELWGQALNLFEMDDTQKDELIDCIFDWTDEDSNLNPMGAEKDYYATQTPSYLPRNGPFMSVEEIMLVKGIDEKMYFGSYTEGKQGPGLKDILGMSPPNTNHFDINSCSKEILMAFLEITEEEADEIIQAREEKAFTNVQEAGGMISSEAMDKLNKFFSIKTGNHFTIRSTGFIYDSPVRYTVEEEVRYVGGQKVYSIISHKDFTLKHADEADPRDEDDE